MNVKIEPGKYVVAVSGGVDSVVLLDLLSQDIQLVLVVAHFDHGIRGDSAEDSRFVEGLCNVYGLEYVTQREELGVNASEALARDRRYRFLQEVMNRSGSRAIITAHHQDDLIETAALNMLRGTKRRGLVSLQSSPKMQRPLLHISKQQIKDYALQRKLEWNEDSTNAESNYLRNKLRKRISPRLNDATREIIVSLLATVGKQNDAIDEIVSTYLQTQPHKGLYRAQLGQWDAEVACEIVAGWLRLHAVSFDTSALVRIINGAKSLQNGSQIDVQAGWFCRVTKDKIILTKR